MVDTVLSMGKSFLRGASAPLYLMTLGAYSITYVKGRTGLGRGRSPPQVVTGRTGLGRGRSPPQVVTEPVLRFDDVHHSLKELPSAGFAGEQVAEARLERGGVCFEDEVGLGRDVASPSRTRPRFVVCVPHLELADDVGNSSRCT